MNLCGRLTLRRKIMLALLLTSSVALTLSTVGFSLNDWFSSRDTLFKQLQSGASIIGSNSVSALLFYDQEAANKTLSALNNDKEITVAVLFTAEDEPFAHYRREGREIPQSLPSEPYGELNSELFVVSPIEFDGEIIGTLLVVADTKQWQERQKQQLFTVLILFVLSLWLVWMLSRRMQTIITEPILKLAQTARTITQCEDFSLRAERHSSDEIGEMVDDFNQMLYQIEQRDHQLQRAREELEEKVAERTEELVEITDKLKHMAYHDALTGLANRITFDERLKAAIGNAKRSGRQLAVLFLDLDRFKNINDTLGHVIGDQLLIEIAKRLSTNLRISDTLARLGGDEFALLLEDINPKTIPDIAEKLIQAINQPLRIAGYNLHVTTSIGITIYPNDGINAESILKHADTAMYLAKDKGRNQFCFFSSDMNARAERRLALEHKLRLAVEQSAFTLYYQPKWDTQTLEISGVEALIRWFDAEEGFISPEEFIPLAEECGLIGKIDSWVLEQACRELLELSTRIGKIIPLAVNFSPTHFIHKNIANEVQEALERTGFPGHKLELEITESLIGSEQIDVHALLNRLRQLGIEIAIDDFGKAYSSLARLKQLPLNTLKIDRSFVMDVGKDRDDEVIIKTIIQMGHNLNLKLVAEGVETEEQYQFLKSHLCDTVQGFLFSKPHPLNELVELHQLDHNQ